MTLTRHTDAVLSPPDSGEKAGAGALLPCDHPGHPDISLDAPDAPVFRMPTPLEWCLIFLIGFGLVLVADLYFDDFVRWMVQPDINPECPFTGGMC